MKKRADGRYAINVTIGYQSNGKRKMKTVYGNTIKEVERKERELRNEMDNGIALIDNDVTISDWANKWLRVYKNNVEYNTQYMYKNAVEKHIIPFLGDMKIRDIRTVHLQNFINYLIANNGKRIAHVCQLTIKQIIKQAVIDRLVVYDVSDGLATIKMEKQEKRTLTLIEKDAIVNAQLDSKQRFFLDVMRYAGLRRGEALALSKKDIDLKNNCIKIDKSLYYQENNPFLKCTKTVSSNRVIPMPSVLFDEAKRYLNEMDDEILFPKQSGGYMTKSSFVKFWDRIMKLLSESSAEEISFTPHICRHTYATDLYYSNIDVKMAQYLLGHSSLNVTMDIYTHLDKTKSNDAIKQFDKYIEANS